MNNVDQPRRLRPSRYVHYRWRRHNPPKPFGNEPRNYLRNTPLYQTDLALNKKFSTLIEILEVEFRSEFYNLLNHTKLYLPSSIGGTNGTNASTGGIITSTFEPRVVQFGLKVLY